VTIAIRLTVANLFHESQAPSASTTVTAAASMAMTDFNNPLTDNRLSMQLSRDQGAIRLLYR
jgi:hypothetical protein